MGAFSGATARTGKFVSVLQFAQSWRVFAYAPALRTNLGWTVVLGSGFWVERGMPGRSAQQATSAPASRQDRGMRRSPPMPERRTETAGCALCEREVALTFHHLIPRKVHRRTRFRRQYSRETLNEGVMLCRLCHRGVHRLYDEMTLATRLNTLGALQLDEAVQRHVVWVRKQRTGQ